MGGTKEIKIITKKSRSLRGSKKGRQHTAHKGKYQKQFYRTAKNKENTWSKHLSNHPNDEQARTQIKKAKREG